MKKIIYLLLAIVLMASCSKQTQSTPSVFEGEDSVLTVIQEWKDTRVMDYDLEDEDCPLAYLDIVIDTLDIQPRYITMNRVVDGYFKGAAHGFHSEEGITFLASSTTPFGWDNILENMPMDTILRISNDLLRAQNPDVIFMQEGQQPLPKNRPYLVNDTVVLVYQEYEIACYADGTLYVKVPICK